ncbi:MAG: hypothetical protein ACKVS8_04370 [Phycisphaerales bacterium]
MPQQPATTAPAALSATPRTRTSKQSPGRPDPAIKEVFLSPRVIDREAFNDFAGSLRALIAEGHTQTVALLAAAAEADAAHAAVREVPARHQARLDAATRALASLDERCGQTERLLGAAKDAACTLEAIRTDADRLIESHTRTVRDRLDQALARTEARLAEFERVAELRVLTLERTLGERIEAGLARLDAHAARATADLGGAAERVVAEISHSAQASADEIRGAAENALAAVSTNHEQHARAAEAARLTLHTAAQAAQHAAQEATGRVQMAARSAEETLRQRETELTDLMARLEDLAAETEALLGHAHEPAFVGDESQHDTVSPAPLPGSLADLVQRATAAAERIEEAQRSLNTLRGEIARDLGVIAAGICP